MGVAEDGTFDRVRRRMVAARVEFLSQLAVFSREELVGQLHASEQSPVHVCYLLYTVDSIALEQMHRVQSEENPLLENIMQQIPLMESAPPSSPTIEFVLSIMAARREEMFEFLSHLPPEAWERPFRYDGGGEHTFSQLVSMLPLYDQQHTRQLLAIKTKHAAQNVD